MDSQNQTPDQQLNSALLKASTMRRQGRDPEYIYNELEFLGFNPEIINRVMNGVTTQQKTEQKREVKSQGNLQLIFGAIILVISVIISVISFILMAPGGT